MGLSLTALVLAGLAFAQGRDRASRRALGLAVEPELKFIARGTVLALAVWLDVRFGGEERG